MNKVTLDQRVQRALERYPFLDEYTVEEVFEALNKLKEVKLSTVCKALNDFGFEDDEALNFYKAFLESDTILVDKKPMCDAVEIKGVKLEIMIIDIKSQSWGRDKSIPEACSVLSSTINDFVNLDSDNIQIWLVPEGTYLNGIGNFNYPSLTTPPMRIK